MGASEGKVVLMREGIVGELRRSCHLEFGVSGEVGGMLTKGCETTRHTGLAVPRN